MKALTTIFMIGIALSFNSCGEHVKGNGNVTEEIRELGLYSKLDISGIFKIELIPGKPRVKIMTDENLHEHIKTKMDGDVLIIHSDDKYLDAEEMVIQVYYKDLKELEISGATSVSSPDRLKGDEFKIEVSGAGEIDLDVKLNILEMELSGGSDVNLTGKTKALELDVSGAADIDAFELEADDVAIDVTGAGEIDVTANKTLSVDITGAGEVTYLGDPEITQSITGAGEIKRKKN